MHKLWPHSLKTSQNETNKKPSTNGSTQPNKENQNDIKNSTSASNDKTTENENNKENLKETQTTSDTTEDSSDGKIKKNTKTPMCLINELVKYNKVITLFYLTSLFCYQSILNFIFNS